MLLDDLRKFLEREEPGSEFNLYRGGATDLNTESEITKLLDGAPMGLMGEILTDRTRYFWPLDHIKSLRSATMYDERQGGPEVETSRFRPRYRKLTMTELSLSDAIKEKAQELEDLYDQVENPGRYKALAITSLEESVMWVVKEITK
jgi:hypothetical protein